MIPQENGSISSGVSRFAGMGTVLAIDLGGITLAEHVPKASVEKDGPLSQ